MGKKTKVAVIILNHNGKRDTVECLNSVRKLNQIFFRPFIIVVDNNSSDGSVAELRKNIS